MTRAHLTPVTPLIAATVFVGLASIAGQGAGAGDPSTGMSLFAAAAFTGAMLRVAWQINRPWWGTTQPGDIGPSVTDAQPMMAARNAELLALTYGWGAGSLLVVYLLTTLRWQHGWQYGCGMGLIAVLLVGYARNMQARWTPQVGRTLSMASLAHGWAATAGVGWLVASGKLFSAKTDWAANIVFFCGGIMIVGISTMAVRTARLLNQR